MAASSLPDSLAAPELDAGELTYQPPTDGTTGVAVDSFVFVPNHGTATMRMFTMAIDIASTPVVQIAKTPIDANEGATTATLTLQLDKLAPTDFDVRVRTQVQSGSTQYPVFAAGDIGERQVRFRAGQTTAAITVMALDDDVVSERTDVALTILPGTGYEVGGAAAGEIRFTDNGDTVRIGWKDCGQPLVVREDVGTARPVIAIEGLASYAFHVVFTDMEGSASRDNDYADPGSIVSITIEPLETQQAVDITIIDSPQIEDTESFELDLFRNGLPREVFILQNSCTTKVIEIIDDDTASFSMAAPSMVDEGEDIVITVTGPLPLDSCIVAFPLQFEITPEGAVGLLQDAATQSVNFAPCPTNKTVTFQTIANAMIQPPHTLVFPLMAGPNHDARVLLLPDPVHGQCRYPAAARFGGGKRADDRAHIQRDPRRRDSEPGDVYVLGRWCSWKPPADRDDHGRER